MQGSGSDFRSGAYFFSNGRLYVCGWRDRSAGIHVIKHIHAFRRGHADISLKHAISGSERFGPEPDQPAADVNGAWIMQLTPIIDRDPRQDVVKPRMIELIKKPLNKHGPARFDIGTE